MNRSCVRQFQVLALLVIMLAASATALHAQTYTVLYNFGNVTCDPLDPTYAGIIAQGRDGNLYSTTTGGGCDVNGAAFKITPKGTLTVIHSFSLGAGNGIGPESGLTLGTDGDFWGTTEGEDFNAGSIFKMTAAGTETNFATVLGNTNDVDGFGPLSPPVQGMDGNFYGVTTSGGNRDLCTYGDAGCGVIYKLTPAGVYKVIYTFNLTNGANPDDYLVLGTDGNFYGTALLGGTAGTVYKNSGVVFKVTPAGKYTQLYAFCAQANCTDGANPYSGLVQGSDGNFYGTTQAGGQGIEFPEGVLFRITPAGKYTLLHTFCTANTSCTDGAQPYGSLVQATDGNFYGTTLYGGANNLGTIFQITPAGTYTVLHSFENTTGSLFGQYPRVTLIQNTNGILYGDTYSGGDAGAGYGVFYSFNMALKPFVSLVAWYGKVGQTVEILGQGLKGATAVSFNGTAATTFTATSATYLTAVVPPGTISGLVTVTTPGGTLTSNRKFLVKPVVESFNPTSGVVGTQVTIAGTSFTGATAVTFGGVKATTFSVNTSTQITATVPAAAKTGVIQVTTPEGTAASAADFTVTE